MTVALAIDIATENGVGMESGARVQPGAGGAAKVTGAQKNVAGDTGSARAGGAESFRKSLQLAFLGVTGDEVQEAGAKEIAAGSGELKVGVGPTPEQMAMAPEPRTIESAGKPARNAARNGVDGAASQIQRQVPIPKNRLIAIHAEPEATAAQEKGALSGHAEFRKGSAKGDASPVEDSRSIKKAGATKKENTEQSRSGELAAAYVSVPIAVPFTALNPPAKTARMADGYPGKKLADSPGEVSRVLSGSVVPAAISRFAGPQESGAARKEEGTQFRWAANEAQNVAGVEKEPGAGIDLAKSEALQAGLNGKPHLAADLQGMPANSVAASVVQAHLQTAAAGEPERSSTPNNHGADGTKTIVTQVASDPARGAGSGPLAGAPLQASAAAKYAVAQAAPVVSRDSSGPTDREKRSGAGLVATGVEASNLGRDPGAARGMPGISAGHPGPGPSAMQPSAHDTFAALDMGSGAGAPNWIHAGAQHAEAGFQDPSLGWVSVRASMSGGAIHAALVPGSSDAAQALTGHLAGLNSHLAAEHIPVHTMTVAAPQWSAGQGAAQHGSHQGSQQGSHGGAGQNSGQGSYARPRAGTILAPGSVVVPGTASAAHPGASDLSGDLSGRGGAYVSVVA